MANTNREEIDTTKNHEYDDLTLEWFKIQNLGRIKAIIRKEYELNAEKTIYLFGRHEDCFRKGAQIFIHLYNLPFDIANYQKELKFYEEQRKSFLLQPKQNFDDSILCLPLLKMELFEHIAFQTKDGSSRKRIFHSYKNKNKAIIVVFSLDTNEFTGNSFFFEVAKNCKIE